MLNLTEAYMAEQEESSGSTGLPLEKVHELLRLQTPKRQYGYTLIEEVSHTYGVVPFGGVLVGSRNNYLEVKENFGETQIDFAQVPFVLSHTLVYGGMTHANTPPELIRRFYGEDWPSREGQNVVLPRTALDSFLWMSANPDGSLDPESVVEKATYDPKAPKVEGQPTFNIYLGNHGITQLLNNPSVAEYYLEHRLQLAKKIHTAFGQCATKLLLVAAVAFFEMDTRETGGKPTVGVNIVCPVWHLYAKPIRKGAQSQKANFAKLAAMTAPCRKVALKLEEQLSLEKALEERYEINTAPPAPNGPAPKEPAPNGPAPKEPAPNEPAPKEPAPNEPANPLERLRHLAGAGTGSASASGTGSASASGSEAEGLDESVKVTPIGGLKELGLDLNQPSSVNVEEVMSKITSFVQSTIV